MKKFKITFADEWECQDQEQVIEILLDYLNDCVKFEDVAAFEIKEIADNE
jgi:hypothetical protein